KSFQTKGATAAQYALLGEKMTPDESGYDSVPVGSSPLKRADQEKANRAARERLEEQEEAIVALESSYSVSHVQDITSVQETVGSPESVISPDTENSQTRPCVEPKITPSTVGET